MTTIQDIRDHNARAGQHWFSPDTLRYFRSRIGSTVYPTATGAYFVSSEQYVSYFPTYHAEPRLYTVRYYDASTGMIDTVGEFQGYASRNGAHAAARRLASLPACLPA